MCLFPFNVNGISLGFGLLVGQNKTFECITLGSGKFSSIFPLFKIFVLIEWFINSWKSQVDDEYNHILQPYLFIVLSSNISRETSAGTESITEATANSTAIIIQRDLSRRMLSLKLFWSTRGANIQLFIYLVFLFRFFSQGSLWKLIELIVWPWHANECSLKHAELENEPLYVFLCRMVIKNKTACYFKHTL